MSFALDPVLWMFLFALVLVARAWLYREPGYSATAFVLSMVLLGSPAFGNFWLSTLERQHDLRGCLEADRSVVVVLGAGLDARYPVDLPAERLSHTSWRRAMASVSLLEDNGTLILSGGGRFVHSDRFSEADSMAALLEPQLRSLAGLLLVREIESSSTFENARYVAETMLNLGLPLNIVLVTSTWHMPRARGVFEKAGFSLCPHAVAPVVQPETPWSALLPLGSGMQKTAIAAHEWLAMALYRSRGWL